MSATGNKPDPVGVRAARIHKRGVIIAALIGMCGVIIVGVIQYFHRSTATVAQSVTNSPGSIQAVKVNNSPIAAVSQSSNVVLKNNSPNTTQIFSSNTLTGLLNLPVNNNGSFTVNINNPVYTNMPDKELQKRVNELYASLNEQGTNIALTRSDILTLAALLKNLDERTEDIQKLPDGRTSFGGIVGGVSSIYGKDRNDAFDSFNRGDFRLAFEQSQKSIKDFESCPSNYLNEMIGIDPASKALSYAIAAVSAVHLGTNYTELAYTYALNAIRLQSTSDYRAIFAITAANLSFQHYNQGHFSNAFFYGWLAVSNYEEVKKTLSHTKPIPKSEEQKMLTCTLAAAQEIGKTNEQKMINDYIGQLSAK